MVRPVSACTDWLLASDVRACVRVCTRACVHVCLRACACVRVCACMQACVCLQHLAPPNTTQSGAKRNIFQGLLMGLLVYLFTPT